MSAATTNTPNLPAPMDPGPKNNQLPQASDLPTLFGVGYGNYPMQPNNFLYSFILHIAFIAIVLLISQFIVSNKEAVKQSITELIMPSDYVLAASKNKAGGGGGGGDREKIDASKGKPPKFKMDQIVPPTTKILDHKPEIEVDPSIVVPPSVNMPTSQTNMGDPLSKALLASNGTGSNSGIGSGSGGGVGSGRGRGLGPGYGGGVGGGAFRVGNGVSAPKPIYSPDPEYSEEARKAKYQGVVTVTCIVGVDGRPVDIQPARSLGMGLDEKVIEVVKTWRFEPGKKDGTPVPVRISVEVTFSLY